MAGFSLKTGLLKCSRRGKSILGKGWSVVQIFNLGNNAHVKTLQEHERSEVRLASVDGWAKE